MPIGDLPGEAGAPVMADQVEAAIAVAESGDNIKCVGDQEFDPVIGMIGRIRPRIDSIPALIRRGCKEP